MQAIWPEQMLIKVCVCVYVCVSFMVMRGTVLNIIDV